MLHTKSRIILLVILVTFGILVIAFVSAALKESVAPEDTSAYGFSTPYIQLKQVGTNIGRTASGTVNNDIAVNVSVMYPTNMVIPPPQPGRDLLPRDQKPPVVSQPVTGPRTTLDSSQPVITEAVAAPPPPAHAQICSPGQWDNCGTHGCGGDSSAQCNGSGSGWNCVPNPATCNKAVPPPPVPVTNGCTPKQIAACGTHNCPTSSLAQCNDKGTDWACIPADGRCGDALPPAPRPSTKPSVAKLVLRFSNQMEVTDVVPGINVIFKTKQIDNNLGMITIDLSRNSGVFDNAEVIATLKFKFKAVRTPGFLSVDTATTLGSPNQMIGEYRSLGVIVQPYSGNICPDARAQSIPYCPNGRPVLQTNSAGCQVYVCQTGTTQPPSPVVCPEFAPPAPTFCKGGVIVSGGKDSNGCQLPPKCVLR